ncbi:MAG: hypothetical protein V4793_13070 [Paraburkholderia tropica]|uniref:hypothetical protein n=1 Tax=Paraburkholderia TaxID=1822464 RepID=UPI00197D39CC|nr:MULTISPECIES: hypothetical protein [Paraburkholderia]MBN3811894.1 hypothetical protein [Paraburkholderia sp. Ac-20347]
MNTTENYRRFQIASSLAPLPNNRAVAHVTVTTTDAARIADLGTDRFVHVSRWVESPTPDQLRVIVDECKVAIDHYADNVDDS